MMQANLLLMTDSYKASHYLQYPPKTTKIYSYIESRGGKFDNLVFFGLQYVLKKLEKGFNLNDIKEAHEIFKLHGLPFNKDGFEYIVKEHDGQLPIRIKALPEGSIVPVLTPLLSIENTDPDCAWITTYLETMLLRGVWYPTTVATYSYHVKQVIRKYMDETSDDLETLPFKLHDFGARGVSSHESAGIGGIAHLVNFMGSDTIESIKVARDIYNCKMPSQSIPAAEHSTICSWGPGGELDSYRNILNQFNGEYPLIAIVSDSYNLWNALDLFGTKLKSEIINGGSTIVIRPDSGNPIEIVSQTLEKLGNYFGYETNSKGYSVLNNVRVIQGDGIDLEMIEKIISRMKLEGWSTSNITFGMGGALLQRLDRDTQNFAMKESYIEIDGIGMDVYKNPVTDPGKNSKKGRQDISEFVTVFEDGKILKEWNLDDIRKRTGWQL